LASAHFSWSAITLRANSRPRARRVYNDENPITLGGREMIWLLVLVLLLLALGGGIFISKFLFIVLIVAIVVAFVARRGSTA
jgi:hypothetical protein